LAIIWIASGDNPADEPSRRLPCHVNPDWKAKCQKALNLANGKWGYAYTGQVRHEKLHDVPTESQSFTPPEPQAYSNKGESSDDEEEVSHPFATLGVNEDWCPEDDCPSDDEVDEQLLHELDACYPHDVNPVTMREGFDRLLAILDGEHGSSEL